MSFLRRYLKGWGSRFAPRPDPRPTIRDTGRGSSKNKSGFSEEGQGQTYEEIKAECLESGGLWEDPDFPAEDCSIFFNSPPPCYPVEWKRPSEFADDPQLIVGEASRFDINQGVLGDCWLLAAVASLATNEKLLFRVVPQDQSFSEDYAGIFRFQFWQYGRWVEVIIDDRLPTYNDKLIYMHSEERNEFWTPLLEKAYAKLNGCYESLSGGLTCEAMTDFTGGVVELVDMANDCPDNLFKVMLRAYEKGSIMGCSINANPDEMEAKLDNGLVIGHAYSVTAVKYVEVETPTASGVIPMVRVRNPWGNECEWRGAWSDSSEEWQFVPDDEKEELGLSKEYDGEFWMSYEDFSTNFMRLEICNLGPDSLEDDDGNTRWEMTLQEGSWRRRSSAGGCRNYPRSFAMNPQYRINIPDADDDDDEEMGTIVVGLMQKGRRKLRKTGEDNHPIGYAIYQLEDSGSGTLPSQYFETHASADRSPNFINTRENSFRHRLTPGEYVIVPSTFDPDQEADFILRVFSEKPNETGEIDEETAVGGELEDPPEDNEEDQEQANRALEAFKNLAGEDGEIDAYELKDILNQVYGQHFDFGGFTTDACRSLVATRDLDYTGKLGFEEFRGLYGDLKLWKQVFNEVDIDGSGHFSSYELRSALKRLKYQLSNSTFSAVAMRYSNNEGLVEFDDFISCMVKLKTMTATYMSNETDDGTSTFQMDEFMQTTMYS
ncbi:unnamed protein product [Owenia fusiformis]|uniref:Uncharacterized protein n=1 Tax=Owenia fusiformis TaxID=6347 RepID=A0A8J1THE8_OWEFU|nr:unnamed protein product [Owenia fusiformis]